MTSGKPPQTFNFKAAGKRAAFGSGCRPTNRARSPAGDARPWRSDILRFDPVPKLPSMPSLPVLAEVTARELETQERRSDALDAKAGVVLGFAGVLVPLSLANLHGNLAHVGAGFAGLAALLASGGFVPRNTPALALRQLRDSYITSEETFTRLRVLDTQIAMHDRTNDRLALKALLITASVLALAVAVILTVIAGILS